MAEHVSEEVCDFGKCHNLCHHMSYQGKCHNLCQTGKQNAMQKHNAGENWCPNFCMSEDTSETAPECISKHMSECMSENMLDMMQEHASSKCQNRCQTLVPEHVYFWIHVGEDIKTYDNRYVGTNVITHFRMYASHAWKNCRVQHPSTCLICFALFLVQDENKSAAVRVVLCVLLFFGVGCNHFKCISCRALIVCGSPFCNFHHS